MSKMEEEKHTISASDSSSSDDDSDGNPPHNNPVSDSESSESPEIPSRARTPEITTSAHRFNSSSDFVPVEFESTNDKGLFLEDMQKSSKELWLIKAPHNIDFEGLNDQQIILNAGQLLSSKSSAGKKYDVMASEIREQNQSAATHILLPSRQSRKLIPGPVFKGQITISESVAVPPVTLPPTSSKTVELPPGLKYKTVKSPVFKGQITISESVAVPPVTLPPTSSKTVELPPGLKCRFVPFGYDEPILLPDSPPHSPLENQVKEEPGSTIHKKKKRTAMDKKSSATEELDATQKKKKRKSVNKSDSSSEEHRKAHKRKIKSEPIDAEESGVTTKKKKKHKQNK